MSGHITTDGVQIAYRIDGTGELPWLIFSNSLATDLSLWDGQVAHLRDHFRILRYNQRGHGASSVPAQPCTFAALAADVIALMDHLGITRASLVGVSMGAVTMLTVAASHPQRVERVLACDGQWAAPTGAAEAWQARIDSAEASGMAALVEPTAARWFKAPFMARPSPALEHVRRMIGATPPGGFIQCARALQAYDLRDQIGAIEVPCMLLVGAEDGSLPGVMRRMADVIPGARYAEVAAAGHLPNLEQPELFNAAAASFLLPNQSLHGGPP